MFDRKDFLVFEKEAATGQIMDGDEVQFMNDYGDMINGTVDFVKGESARVNPEDGSGPLDIPIHRLQAITPGFAEQVGNDFRGMADNARSFGRDMKEQYDFTKGVVKDDIGKVKEFFGKGSMLDYQHNTWNGYFNQVNNRPYDDFTKKLKDISRG